MTNQKTLIAIDPGKGGGYAIREENGHVTAHKFKDEAVAAAVMALLAETFTCEAVIERVHAMPGQGVTSMFSFGANYGFWRGVLQALRIPFREVTPQQWQKGLVSPKLKGVERKRALLQVARERYPSANATLATADAILILDTQTTKETK